MPKTFRKMPAFNGVGNQTATLNMPIGLTYHNLLLTLGGTTFTPTHITEMRLKANGRTVYTVVGADLNIINKYDGRANGTAHVFLDFERFGLKTRMAIETTAIGTDAAQNLDTNSPAYNPTPLSTLQLEVDISGSTAPTLEASALQSGAKPLGVIRHRRKFTYSPSAAGDFEISDLPKGLLIDKIYFKGAGSNLITDLKIDRDNFRLFDRSKTQNDLIQTDGVRVSQANWFVYDPTESGNGAESLATRNVQDLRFILTMSAADTVTVYVDYIGGFSG